MSTPSDSTIKGNYNEAAGNVKQGVGEAVGNEKLANEGAADQVKGKMQEAWGSVKEGVADLKSEHEAKAPTEAHNFREGVTNAAESVRNSVKEGMDHLTHKDEKKY